MDKKMTGILNVDVDSQRWYTKLPFLEIKIIGWNVWTLNQMNQPIKFHLNPLSC